LESFLEFEWHTIIVKLFLDAKLSNCLETLSYSLQISFAPFQRTREKLETWPFVELNTWQDKKLETWPSEEGDTWQDRRLETMGADFVSVR
jgi:hypothetical protein